MLEPVKTELEELWKQHKARFGTAPDLALAPPEVMAKALRAALGRGEPVGKAELTGDNVVSINKKRWINCRVFL